MAFGQRGAQAESPAVGIAVQLAGRALERLERGRHRSVGPFVGRELDHALEPELALHLLDRLARLVGHDPRDRGREEAVGDLRKRHEARAYWTL